MPYSNPCDSAKNEYQGDGTTVLFSVTFEYAEQSDVKVYLWNDNQYELTTDWTWANATQIQFNTAPAIPSNPATINNVRIVRETSIEPLSAQFYPGASIKAKDLNDNFEQLKFAVEENRCIADSDYWKKYEGTIHSNETWSGSDNLIATTAAIDATFLRQDSSETISSGVPWSNSDAFVATTAAIDARIVDLVEEVGGFVPIDNETSFPEENPDINDDAGTLISIKEITTDRGIGGGTVTIANGAGTNTVTITGVPTTGMLAGYGAIVETTSTLHTYTFHRLSPPAVEATTVANNIGNINTVATDITNVNTVATDITNVNTVATNITDVNTVATDIADVSTLATNIGDIQIIEDNIADIQTVASDLNEPVSEIDTVATNIANVNTVGTGINSVNTVSGSIANVNAVGTSIADVNAVAPNIGDVSTVAASIGDVNVVEDNIANINTVASDLNEPVSEIDTVASNIANVNTTATNITNVNTVATDIANVNTVATDIANVNSVAANVTNINTVANNNTDIATVAANISDINIVENNIGDIQVVENNIADIQTVADDLNEAVSEINTVGTNIANVNAVGSGITNVNTVATNITDVNTVATDIANVNTTASSIANVNTTATNIAKINTVANDLNELVSEIDTVATNITNVNNVGTSISNVNTVATNIANVNTVSSVSSDVTTVAGISSDVTAVAGSISNVNTAAGSIANINTVANDLNEATSEIDTVATNIANVNTVGNSITNVNTVATNISSVNDFAERYRVSATAPTTSLDDGDLWWDTTTDTLKVYDATSSSWVAGVTDTTGFVTTSGSTMTGQLNTITPVAGDNATNKTYVDGTIDSKIDTALTNDVVGGTGITVSDNTPGSGQITLDVTAGSIGSTQLASTTVTPGSYTAADITVDADGRITAAANGSINTITGDFTVDTSTLKVDSTNNRVGIGTASPLTDLDVNGAYAGSITAVAALDIDCSTANYFTKTISANSTFTFSNAPSSRAYGFTLELTHTSGTVTWPAAVKWPGDTAPTLTTGKTHLFVFVTDDGGTRWRGAASVDYVN